MLSVRSIIALTVLLAAAVAQLPLVPGAVPGTGGVPVVGTYGGMSPPICMSGQCVWNCGTNARKCRGLYYCGPLATVCMMTCPKGACTDEIALISHSSAKTKLSCYGEATCTKMLLNCGNVDPTYIHDLNNLPGNLQNIFENMPPQVFQPSRMVKPYGSCSLECGLKSCDHLHMICQGSFANGKGCSVSAQAKDSFKDSYLHCAMSNPKSFCQANCGAGARSNNQGMGGHVPPALLYNYQQLQVHEPPCQNSQYLCFRGKCYCAGYGCSSIEFQRTGVVRFGFSPVARLPVTPAKTTTKKAAAKKTAAAGKTAAKKTAGGASPRREWRWLPRVQQRLNQMRFVYQQKAAPAGQTPGAGKGVKGNVRPFYWYDTEPIKPDNLIGVYTHLICMTQDCKVECQSFGSCAPLTIVAGPRVKKLVVECAQEACVGLKVETEAIENDFKCIDHGACASASFQCGKPQRVSAGGKPQSVPPNPFVPRATPFIKRCKVECQNGGCAKHNNPQRNMVELKGVHVTCHSQVISCELHADSASSRFNFPSGGMVVPGFGAGAANPKHAPQGSFDSGLFDCFVSKVSVAGGVGAPTGTTSVPRCLLKCSTHIWKRFCGGVRYRCTPSAMQCHCEDFCTGHAAECLANPSITRDCPRLLVPAPPKAATTTVKPAAAATTKGATSPP